MKEAQLLIEKIVEDYKMVFPVEYRLVVAQLKLQRKAQKNEFASVKGDHVLERKLIEVPENLFNVFIARLPQTFIDYYYSKPGIRWFAKRYPEFRIAEKI